MKRARLGPLWWVLFVGVLAGLTVAVTTSLRTGGYVMAATCALVGVVRAAIPERAAEGASVRSRGVDLMIYLGMALALVIIFGTVKLSLPT